MIDAVRIAVAIVIVTLMAAYPFLPGRYDASAVPMSMLARIFGIAALLVVPFGVLWLIYARRGLAIASLIALGLVCAFVSLAGFAIVGLWFSIGFAVAGALLIVRLRSVADPRPVAFYLIALPIAFVLIQWAMVRRGVEFSRDRAIRNCAPLIADIERFRATQGHYPVSLQALWNDYDPRVIGVKEYRYEPSGEAYNVSFEQYALELPTHEIVVYNPLDQQEATSHNSDLLRYPEQMRLRRGYFAVHDAGHPHWKYFWFD